MARKRIAWGVAFVLLAMFVGAAWLGMHSVGPRTAYDQAEMFYWPDRFSPDE